jgi:hypothetical protein
MRNKILITRATGELISFLKAKTEAKNLAILVRSIFYSKQTKLGLSISLWFL